MYLPSFSNVKNVLTKTSLVQQSNNFNLAILGILVTYTDRVPYKQKYFPVQISNYKPTSRKYCEHPKTVHKKCEFLCAKLDEELDIGIISNLRNLTNGSISKLKLHHVEVLSPCRKYKAN